MAKLNVYTLGQFGVNRVKSPLQVKDGELLSCQNASPKLIQRQLSLSKRDGMAKINSTAANGTLLAIENIPFANPSGFGNGWTQSGLTSVGTAHNDIMWADELGLFVAVGPGTPALTSSDGITWNSPSMINGTWFGIEYSPELNLLVACNDTASPTNSRFATSPDGTTWTLQTSPADMRMKAVAWSPTLGLFASCAASSLFKHIVTSPDGVNWTLASGTVPTLNLNDIVWAPALGLFVAVSGSTSTTQVITSPDGNNWTLRTTNNDSVWSSICWDPVKNLLVAVASGVTTGTQVMTSPDAITWTPRNAASTNQWNCVTASSGNFVAVADTGVGNRVMTSPDGITWTSQSAPDKGWHGVAYSPSLALFASVSISGGANAVMVSP